MLKRYMQMQNRFAGIKPNWDVRNPIAQTIRQFMLETTSPVQDLRATSIVARIVRKHER
jgi:hypothetical protein